MSNRNEYLSKMIVFGAGFMPTPDEAGTLYNNGLIPPESSHTRTMVPFKIDGGSEKYLIQQADLILTSGGTGCGLDRNDYDHKIVELGSKIYILAWIRP